MTSADQVAAWAQGGESETLELKRSTAELRSGLHALTALLNHRGGRVLFGVDPSRQVLGQHVSDGTLESLAQELGHIEPPCFPRSSVCPWAIHARCW